MPNSSRVRDRLFRAARPLGNGVLVSLLALVLFAGLAAAARGHRTRSSVGPAAGARIQNTTGCCNAPGVENFGQRIDFGNQGEDTEISDQYRSMGILFGNGATPLASETVIRYDPDRGIDCPLVLNGDPPFSGWEYLIFVNPSASRWSKVQSVGGVVGWCDIPNSVFIAAYDEDGQLLTSKFNEQTGFEFIWIQRPTADIAMVLIGDCQGGGVTCVSDPAGTALNCLTFTPPVPTTTSLPDTIRVPEAPHVQGTPGASFPGLIALAALLAGASFATLRRRSHDRAVS